MELLNLSTRTFEELAAVLANLPNQQMGQPNAICETGEPYREFLAQALARPDDVAVIEREVVQDMLRQLAGYFSDRHGQIYWRIPLEHEVTDWGVAIRFSVDGPNIDFITNKRCVQDHNWRRLACYCRLYRAVE